MRCCLAGLGVVVGCFLLGFLVVWVVVLVLWFGFVGLGGKVCEMPDPKRWLMGLDKKLFHRKKNKRFLQIDLHCSVENHKEGYPCKEVYAYTCA